MWKIIIKKWSYHFFIDILGIVFFGLWFFWLFPTIIIWALAILVIAIIVATFQTAEDLIEEYKKKYQEEVTQREQAQRETQLWKKSLVEKTAGFPTLFKAIAYFDKIKDEKVEQFLRYKSHPSKKGAEVVKEETKRRRQAEYENRKTSAIIEYYESIAPFLVDLKNDIVDDEEKFREYSGEEQLDRAIEYLTKEEFRKLPSVERNQMALDRFWDRPKSKKLIGKIYERYVGYIFETNGYDVEYFGIFKGFEDLGRDLICQKGNEFIVIQCKNWSQFRTIYEKHIFQFFGTVFQYRDANPKRNVRAIFYTSTELSDLARRFAGELGMELKENFKLDKTYPCIKCNISKKDGTKIYHLPFDQRYDDVKIEKNRGEFYCATVAEAESKGFRRAFRYRGIKKE